MLRKFLFVSLAVITLASCKKDKDDAPAYYVSAKIDGVKQDFNTAVLAQKIDSKTVYISAAGGTATAPFPMINLDIDADADITAKIYTASTNYEAYASYNTSSQASYESGEVFSITVTSITATEIKGTFSGEVEDGATIKKITEGSFSAKFQ